jgi:putative ABC transport system permease protein
MFFVTYVRRELRRRMRQAIFIALGLAVGVGLVVTVAAASAGVKKAQSGVLGALYGVGTDVTVTGAPPGPPPHGSQGAPQFGPNGSQTCTSNGTCTSMAGKTTSTVVPSYSAVSAAKLAQIAKLRGVAAAGGVLALSDQTITYPKAGSIGAPQPGSLTIDGVDTGHPSPGPLSGATLTSGHGFTAADAHAAAAVVDFGYAKSRKLTAGSDVTIGTVTYTIIGIARQPQQGGTPADIYLPLARAQDISTPYGRQKNDVNTIYLAAASAADAAAVGKQISTLLPGATVTTAAGLASQVTGSISSVGKLANDLGRWLAVLVLIAAFAVASLLTMAAVARRVREFGTLKALGWRTRRIIAQVLGESVAIGLAGAAAGVGLGFAGAAIIAAVAPNLSAAVPQNNGAPPGNFRGLGGNTSHQVLVPLHPSVSAGVIVLAVVLAVAGALLAGALGSWRIAKLRPADALSRVA